MDRGEVLGLRKRRNQFCPSHLVTVSRDGPHESAVVEHPLVPLRVGLGGNCDGNVASMEQPTGIGIEVMVRIIRRMQSMVTNENYNRSSGCQRMRASNRRAHTDQK